MNRKEFFNTLGKAGAGVCMCAAAGSLQSLSAQEPLKAQPGDKTAERAVKRMEFADHWIKRFFDVMDETLDEETRKKIMMTNGKSCYQSWIAESGRKIQPVDFEEWVKRASQQAHDEGFRIDGNTIWFQYNTSAETGAQSPGVVCLCPMVESKPAGMSKTYCHCSIGYVKEMYEGLFGRQVEVELLDSVLMGSDRCRFKIVVS
jgi:hypothetical protein